MTRSRIGAPVGRCRRGGIELSVRCGAFNESACVGSAFIGRVSSGGGCIGGRLAVERDARAALAAVENRAPRVTDPAPATDERPDED